MCDHSTADIKRRLKGNNIFECLVDYYNELLEKLKNENIYNKVLDVIAITMYNKFYMCDMEVLDEHNCHFLDMAICVKPGIIFFLPKMYQSEEKVFLAVMKHPSIMLGFDTISQPMYDFFLKKDYRNIEYIHRSRATSNMWIYVISKDSNYVSKIPPEFLGVPELQEQICEYNSACFQRNPYVKRKRSDTDNESSKFACI